MEKKNGEEQHLNHATEEIVPLLRFEGAQGCLMRERHYRATVTGIRGEGKRVQQE
jgi:hypothetical protein